MNNMFEARPIDLSGIRPSSEPFERKAENGPGLSHQYIIDLAYNIGGSATKPQENRQDMKNDEDPRLIVWHLRELDYFCDRTFPSRQAVTIVAKPVFIDEYIATLSFGMAFCSPNDQFSRKIGRELALKRIENMDYFAAEVDVLEKRMTDRDFVFFTIASWVLVNRADQMPKFAKELIRSKMLEDIHSIRF